MINTETVRRMQCSEGAFRLGSGPDIMLIVGSCRCVPYLNYFAYLDAGTRFTIYFIDPLKWCWDERGKIVPDFLNKLSEFENDKRILKIISTANWYIHEHYLNCGMFNSTPIKEKNIFQFGMVAVNNITIPNFGNHLILFQEFLQLNKDYMAAFKALGKLSDELQATIKDQGLKHLNAFCDSCRLSDFPEMGDLVRANWKKVRYFATINHVTNEFTIALFRLLNDKFLHLETNQQFWDRIHKEDMYAYPRTGLTSYDRENYGIEWPEPLQPIAP